MCPHPGDPPRPAPRAAGGQRADPGAVHDLADHQILRTGGDDRERKPENRGVPGAGGAVPKNQRLSAAQQYDAEAVCDRADRE